MFLIWLLNHHCQYVSVSYTGTVRKWNNFSWCTSKLASTNWLRAPRTGQSTAPRIRKFFSATTFPQGHLEVSALRIFFFFCPFLGCWLHWDWKSSGKSTAASLGHRWQRYGAGEPRKSFWNRRWGKVEAKNHKHFFRTAAWKDFKNPFGFWHPFKKKKKKELHKN